MIRKADEVEGGKEEEPKRICGRQSLDEGEKEGEQEGEREEERRRKGRGREGVRESRSTNR